ncbi:MAG: nucleoside monophosphate kinase [Patescibacteria group bacterium]|nr:nucleoside monophosphate kinase [Patescibacteria group bacterium]
MMKSNSSPLDIIVYGGPGSGKSTQAEFLIEEFKAKHLNMGGLLRNVIAKKLSGYKDTEPYVNAGKLVPEKISSKLVRNFVKDSPKSKRIIFDGYPRRRLQISYLEKIQKEFGRKAIMVFVDLPAKVAKDRLISRAKIEGRKDDADPKIVGERIAVFKKQSEKVLDYYKKHGRLIVVNGDQTINGVKKDIFKNVKEYEYNY